MGKKAPLPLLTLGQAAKDRSKSGWLALQNKGLVIVSRPIAKNPKNLSVKRIRLRNLIVIAKRTLPGRKVHGTRNLVSANVETASPKPLAVTGSQGFFLNEMRGAQWIYS